jgi:hypothetical protein
MVCVLRQEGSRVGTKYIASRRGVSSTREDVHVAAQGCIDRYLMVFHTCDTGRRTKLAACFVLDCCCVVEGMRKSGASKKKELTSQAQLHRTLNAAHMGKKARPRYLESRIYIRTPERRQNVPSPCSVHPASSGTNKCALKVSRSLQHHSSSSMTIFLVILSTTLL